MCQHLQTVLELNAPMRRFDTQQVTTGLEKVMAVFIGLEANRLAPKTTSKSSSRTVKHRKTSDGGKATLRKNAIWASGSCLRTMVGTSSKWQL
jgi:hypothetical protein